MDTLTGDGNALLGADGSGDDFLDLGAEGGYFVIGDHNTFTPGATANGAGDDRIFGGSAADLLIGDSAADNTSDAGKDRIEGRGGNDTLFGDNTDVDGTRTVGTAGGRDRLEGGAGDDTLRAGPGDDRLDGGQQTDDCDGEAGTGDIAVRCETVVGIP
ncbi:hypothetical protein [Streptomyces sp. NBC_00347]|uniref:calcium-binding protein n=1 Tax=Streptomyces sp. NBC_00347 TaxID=2975721 RepID=UPI002B1DA7FA|nr:hypothetical protein [Streptomyces sp. NBC_00347]